jgi:copper chaperone NosL
LLLIFINNRKAVLAFFTFFVLFVILAGIDFYRWNYEYGHNLDPNAAIKVPGMAYQPPLIGYKQLLNFGAYSIPDIGGWMNILDDNFFGIYLQNCQNCTIKNNKSKSVRQRRTTTW